MAHRPRDRAAGTAMRQGYMGALPRRGMDESSADDGLCDLPEDLSDESREWIRKVVAMNDEDAEKAMEERSVIALDEESDRKHYEHFLTQIP